ncbi:MAG: hypothetical protein K8S94_15570 [Planctomycetia bacterium]|nr:hypothetical protein [Planctomycetia bacterium]
MGSLASTNRQPITGVKPVGRLNPFPPAPKSVRVVSVFSEEQHELSPAGRVGECPRSHHGALWSLWLLGITVFAGLVIAALFRAHLWNHLSN